VEAHPHEVLERVTSVGPERRRRSPILALCIGLVLAGAMAAVLVPRIRRHDAKVRFHKISSTDTLYDDRALFAAAWDPATAPPGRRHLPRFPIPERIGKQLFPVDEKQPWDDLTYLRRPSNLDFQWKFREHPGGSIRFRTNSLGMRENSEPLAQKGDLRILVTGDSHTEGVCNNVESFPHVLRRELLERHPGKVIECLNAGKGSFTFYNYLGTLEKFLDLQPDVFVVAVYGSNDFLEVVAPYHYFEGTPRKPGYAEYREIVEKLLGMDPAWLSQDGLSLKYFQHYPEEIPVAMKAAKEAVLDIQELCQAHGILLAFVYIPGMFDVDRRKSVRDPELVALSRKLYDAMELEPKDLDLHEKMGNELLAFLAERGIPCLDLRPVFASRPERLYWLEDHHMDVDAHKAIGEALVPVIEALQPKGLR
jgi:lysophospholipase L1-like esterase